MSRLGTCTITRFTRASGYQDSYIGENVNDKYYPRISCALSNECDHRNYQCPCYDCEMAEQEKCEECELEVKFERCSCNCKEKFEDGEKGISDRRLVSCMSCELHVFSVRRLIS